MTPLSIGRSLLLACGLAVAYLALSLVLVDDYGPTWDCAFGEYHHGHRYLAFWTTLDRGHLDFRGGTPAPPSREPHLDDGVDWMPWNQSYPFAATLSAAACRLLWTAAGWRDALVAHHVVVPLFTSLLLVALVSFAGSTVSWVAALATALALLASPRFLAHSMNNLKDVPEAALYAGTVLALYAAITGGRRRWWIVGGLLGGLALAQKPNGLFLPPHGLALLVGIWLIRVLRREPLPRPWHGIVLASAAFVGAYGLASPMLWDEPLLRLAQRYQFVFDVATNPAGVDPTEGLRAVAWTTPPMLMLLAAVGVLHPRLGAERRWLLLLGIGVPLARTLLPGMVNFDGVRHFLEFFPFAALAAGLGADLCVRAVLRVAPAAPRGVPACVVALLFAHPLWQSASLHPHGVCYFNALAGGLAGAQETGFPDATDYWGGSYLQGLRWLREHGEPDAAVIVPVAEHVARCVAPIELPADGRGPVLADPYEAPRQGPAYVMFITRSQWYEATVRWVTDDREPVFEVAPQGAPAMRLFRIDEPDDVATVHRLWSEGRAAVRLGTQMALQPEAAQATQILRHVGALGFDRAVRELRAIAPDHLQADIEPAVRYLLRPREDG